MSSPKNDSTEFIGNSDTHGNHLTRCDEKTSTEEEDITRSVEENSKVPEKCITKETAAKKGRKKSPKKGREETAAKKGHEETAAKKGHEETAAKKGHEETAAKKGHEETAAKKGRKKSPKKGPEETAATKGPEETAATKGPEETAATKGPEETAATKGHENNGDLSVDEVEVISKPECPAGEPKVDSELEICSIKKNVPDEIQKQKDVERIGEKESTGSVASQRQSDDKLNSAFIDEENALESVESDDDSLSDEDEILSYNTTNQELTVGKISENVLQVFEERYLQKEEVSRSTQISGGLMDQDCEADSRTTAAENDETCIRDSGEVASRNGVADAVEEEENEDISTYSKMLEVHNVATSTKEVEKGKIEEIDPNVSAAERNEDCSALSKVTKIQNGATSTEVEAEVASTEVAVDEGLSPNGKELAAKQIPRSPREMAAILAKYLSSKENLEVLDEINGIVKQLKKQSSAGFSSSERSTEDRSDENLKTLKEFYSQQLQKLATKRKSKICELDEDAEDIQAITKKCKLSNAFDIPFEIENWETSCCLEEQFRIAFKETNDGKEKEYKFPLSSGNEQPRKFCKHQIAKIDAMVASVMSLDSYMSQLPDRTDKPNNSTEDVYEDTPCCYHTKAQSSSSSSKSKDEVLSGPQESVREKMIADSNECSEASDKTKWLSYFTFEGALKSIKNVTLFVSFTGSLMVAMTAGRLFGVDFPVSRSKRNTIRDNSSQEFPTL